MLCLKCRLIRMREDPPSQTPMSTLRSHRLGAIRLGELPTIEPANLRRDPLLALQRAPLTREKIAPWESSKSYSADSETTSKPRAPKTRAKTSRSTHRLPVQQPQRT